MRSSVSSFARHFFLCFFFVCRRALTVYEASQIRSVCFRHVCGTVSKHDPRQSDLGKVFDRRPRCAGQRGVQEGRQETRATDPAARPTRTAEGQERLARGIKSGNSRILEIVVLTLCCYGLQTHFVEC